MTEPILAKKYDVFVSYKREDDAARAVLCDALKVAGFDPWWDAKLGAGDFRDQLRDEINRCDVVIALWSTNAHARPDEVKMEMAHAFGIKKLLPVRIDNAPIPPQFAGNNFLPFDGWRTAERAAQQLAHIMSEARKFGAAPSLIAPKAVPAAIPVHLGGIPPAPDKLVGREAEMQLLRDAWHGGANAVVLHALGGAGKSALLRAFVNERLAKGGDGAARIYGWSAYSQGAGEEKRADADGFITRALADFGYDGPPIRDAVDRARKLAELIQRERVLLLLDGLEPLQDPPGLNKGRFKDKGLAALVKALGNQNPGLMVMTSRQEVPELEGAGSLVIHHALEELSDDAGAKLLVELGVRGRERELREAVHELGGHALSVSLLGTYLTEVCGGDIRHRDQFDFGDVILTPEEAESSDKTVRYAKRAEKVMAGYLEQFDKLAEGQGAEGLGRPERALLHVLGLFDRPAEGAAVDMLLSERIPGLTDDLFVEPVEKRGFLWFGKRIEFREISADERMSRLREARRRLRKLRLLAKADAGDPRSLDAHPVVRAYFSSRLLETAPEAARTAHERLYRYYAAAAADLPDTIAEMQPLFHAIQHGVRAGLVQDVFNDVYWRRLRRGNQVYLPSVLGGTGADLAILASFFDKPWTVPHPALGEGSLPLNLAANALLSVGRLVDSVAPRRASMNDAIASGDLRSAALDAGLLSDTLLTLGNVDEAVAAAERSLALAEKSGDRWQQFVRRGTLASALSAKGDVARATAYFQDAEAIHAEDRPQTPRLYNIIGYLYGDLLLAESNAAEALDRGRYLMDVGRQDGATGFGLFNTIRGALLTGRALDALGDPEAAGLLDDAVDGLRKSGRDDHVPQGLLARAAHRRKRVAAGETQLLAPLRHDLAEVADIAGSEMRLYLTDLALESARLALDVPSAFADPRAEAARQIETAARLIAETGYRSRDRELGELRRRFAAMPASPPGP